MINVQKYFTLFIFSVILVSCTRDVVEEFSCDSVDIPVYEGEVDAVINRTCAYVGCHIQGFGFGDYTTYNSILVNDLDVFVSEITTGDMPDAVGSGPDTLTTSELVLLQCWIQGGALEN
jgi:hypothetical protein